ncbi:MAG: pyridoxamine 5'-phosphate oxidase family protein [Cyclobacteriaceae bacterium]
MLEKNVRDRIDTSVLCWLATVDPDGMPHVSPKELFTYDDTGALVIANIASPHSVKNIRTNPKVCVSFVDVFVQKGYKIQGEATLITPSDSLFEVKTVRLRAMAGDTFSIRMIISVAVEQVAEIIAPRYRFFPDTREEDQIRSALHTYKVKELLKSIEQSDR